MAVSGWSMVITDLKNMADYIALQYFVFLQKDLARETQGKFVDNAYLHLCFNAL